MKKIPNKVKIAASILLFYLLAAAVGPSLANEEAIHNWNNKMYWADNPKLVPPSWINLFGKNLPPTENLAPTKIEGNLYVYEYDFRYSEAPQDIIVYSEFPCDMTINITLPDGREYTLYRGLSRSKIRLGMMFMVMGKIAQDKGLNYTDSDLIFRGGLDPIFMGKDGVEKGTYIIEITSENEPKVRVLGRVYGILGTDSTGRDIWQGFVWGFRETMVMVVTVGFTAVAIGAVLGVLSALYGIAGTVTDALTKLSTILPLVPVMVMMVPITGKVTYGGHLEVPFWSFVLLMGLLLFGKIARNVRALVETELGKEYVESAISLGGSRWWILRHHVSRAVLPYSVYQFSIVMPKVVALVSLLGFFEAIPGFNWGTLLGNMITENQLFSMAWWIVVPIGAALAVFAMAFVLINLSIEDRFLTR
ncbi:ABC transporter permease [Thermococcus thioreducens]|uniref:Peptide ABC transporter permease n=1 Tax=Thermococcus thioreducens TaxID=277988 RepID=A0A0Q2M1Y8_9EURY|nr:ABC transporter permease [Thermococcus thioreducens]ASJ11505.1 peptide ABC transporter permease [Thermococcus thioreducens]KQH81882.1 peptide ABC transporter permease [Thermococcus thioreducens]SEW05473.1 peptide/nickel transport system permease protein [Thermococcus thioreducens]